VPSRRLRRVLLIWVPIVLGLALVGAVVGALIGRRVLQEGCGSRRLAPSQTTTRLYCVRETHLGSTPALVLSNVQTGDDVLDDEAVRAVHFVLRRAPRTVDEVCYRRRGIDTAPVCTQVDGARKPGLSLATVSDPDDQLWNPVPIVLGAGFFVSLLVLRPALKRSTRDS
jgi:hypothetical protein